ncbi:MAG: hypothetical protein RLY16_1590 [Bacteroidota bacterium]|jgi:hypothetical protein
MQKALLLILLFWGTQTQQVFAQDTLPAFSAKKIGNKAIISWRNTYGARIANINIQRSSDSIRNFTTIGSVLEPNNSDNGFVDTKMPEGKWYYRVFVAFNGGSYIYTKSKVAVLDTIKKVTTSPIVIVNKAIEDSLIFAQTQLLPNVNTGNNNNPNNGKPTTPKPAPPPPPKLWTPSKLVFTGKDNNVIIDLPKGGKDRYHVHFYDDKDNFLFEIKLPESHLIIEKVNFLHSGWFFFKLYDKGTLLEKNKLYIPREGKYGIPAGDPGRILTQ